MAGGGQVSSPDAPSTGLQPHPRPLDAPPWVGGRTLFCAWPTVEATPNWQAFGLQVSQIGDQSLATVGGFPISCFTHLLAETIGGNAEICGELTSRSAHRSVQRRQSVRVAFLRRRYSMECRASIRKPAARTLAATVAATLLLGCQRRPRKSLVFRSTQPPPRLTGNNFGRRR